MYSMFIDTCDKMYLTRIEAEDKDADVYFPKFFADEWIEILEYECMQDDISIKHMIYKKK